MPPKEVTSTEFNPRHRVIGAIILVVLAVIFVPLVLEEDAPQPEIRQSAAPVTRADSDGGIENKMVVAPVTRIGRAATTADAPGAAADKASDAPAPAAAVVPAPAEPPPVEARPAPDVAPKTAAVAPRPSKPEPAATISGGWVVQVGVYSNAANAARMRERLKQHGHPVTTENVTLEGGKAVRVRVGPYPDKATALKTQARIKKETGVLGLVAAYP